MAAGINSIVLNNINYISKTQRTTSPVFRRPHGSQLLIPKNYVDITLQFFQIHKCPQRFEITQDKLVAMDPTELWLPAQQ